MHDPLEPFPFACAAGVCGPEASSVVTFGDARAVFPLASVSKLLASYAALIAVDQGYLSLDDPAGPEGSTVRHLLAHASGYAFEGGTLLAQPGTRRMYTNFGIEELGRELEGATGCDLDEWIEIALVQPLSLQDVVLTGSPAKDYCGSVADLLILGRELLHPTLVGGSLAKALRTPQFPELSGVLPGYGRQSPNLWGLGPEIRGEKRPHWTGTRNSPAAFGHFGQSGSFLWVDPVADACAAFLGAEPFGEMHVQQWPALSDALLERL